MKTVIFLVLFVPFLVKASYQCPGTSVKECTRQSDQYSCIGQTFISQLPQVMKTTCANTCNKYQAQVTKICRDNCPIADCIVCMDEVQNVVNNCKQFYKKAKGQPGDCDKLERQLIKCCTHQSVCKVCHDSFCKNGGVCKGGPNILSCKCPRGYTGIYCQKSHCSTRYCQNGGTCIGPNTCACPADYTGKRCERKRLGTKLNPAPNAKAILDAGDSVGSGLYWIQPPGEQQAAQTYCDMTYSDGGWMLASYGYVATAGIGSGNKAIPNMNNPMGYAWRPTNRASRNGLINLPHGAVMMARNATYMIMAAGNNPNTDIDQYSHVYRIDLRQNTFRITFANHNAEHGATGRNGFPKMHVSDFLVVGLKGDVGEFERFALAESLGVTWSDTYPTGYGFNNIGTETSSWDKGPFFPSVHSGDRQPGAKCHGAPCRSYQPDISRGSEHYVHRGWYTASGTVNQVGQTSIWFK